MEDMARLALIEQSVRNSETFSKILYELLRHINHILEDPHDYEIRIINSETLRRFLKNEALGDYLKSIGFQCVENAYTYPKEQALSNLRMAQAAIERKIYFCCGTLSKQEGLIRTSHKHPSPKPAQPALTPVKLENISNPLLQELETRFNMVLQYEDEELQALARQQIPLVSLQLIALDEMREHQKKIKTGETKEHDMSFDMALLRVMLNWFKGRYFTWVDAPPCDACGGGTVHTATVQGDTCRVERYKCSTCGCGAEFPRYNCARTLLRTRRGRCGEWANCFALMCRALGYDTRLVYSTSDHVWCEIWDYDSTSWVHADPCEAALDAPLLYAVGWKRELCHVLAVSKDDLQDVTWRYTVQHKEVLRRRMRCGECDESTMVTTLLRLREARQAPLPAARRRYLARRTLRELAEMLTERKVSPREVHGRSSGAAAWRAGRGEGAPPHAPYTFRFRTPGDCGIKYFIVGDRYEVENGDVQSIDKWEAGAYSVEHVFRKVEHDWKMVYLAREEGTDMGHISWRICTEAGYTLRGLRVRVLATVFGAGAATMDVRFDDDPPTRVALDGTSLEWSCEFTRCELRANLGGGDWQHAQLFRTSNDAANTDTPSLTIHTTLRPQNT